MWERWDGWTPEKGFQDAGMNSFNHYWLGCVGEWIFTRLAGVDTIGAGWKTIYLNPYFTKKLTHVDFGYDSIRGRVESHWKWNGDSVDWTVVIPANTTAMIAVPAFLKGKKVETLGSGTYHLTAHP
jgi:alpha-L-rhamnosidase